MSIYDCKPYKTIVYIVAFGRLGDCDHHLEMLKYITWLIFSVAVFGITLISSLRRIFKFTIEHRDLYGIKVKHIDKQIFVF